MDQRIAKIEEALRQAAKMMADLVDDLSLMPTDAQMALFDDAEMSIGKAQARVRRLEKWLP